MGLQRSLRSSSAVFGGSMQVGDLIYSNHDDEYAIYLGGNSYDGWIHILQNDGTTCQVQKQWWEVIQ